MTIDDLFELGRAYPEFDMELTVKRIGRGREAKQASRKFRKRRGS